MIVKWLAANIVYASLIIVDTMLAATIPSTKTIIQILSAQMFLICITWYTFFRYKTVHIKAQGRFQYLKILLYGKPNPKIYELPANLSSLTALTGWVLAFVMPLNRVLNIYRNTIYPFEWPAGILGFLSGIIPVVKQQYVILMVAVLMLINIWAQKEYKNSKGDF